MIKYITHRKELATIFLNRKQIKEKLISSTTQHKFWFIDIPRTGSSSLRKELGSVYGEPFDKGNVQDSGFGGPLGIIPDHMTAMQTKNLMGEEHWSSLFSFTIVRNPWARAYSLFQYRLKIKKDIPSDLPFETYLTALQAEKKKPSWLQSWYHGYLLSSCQFISSKVGDIIISKVYKFEDRKGMVADLNTHLSHPISGNLHLMKTGEGQPYQSFYTTKSKTIVSDLYRDDIELFNYSFDAPSF